jgi:hypothetical protein
MAEHDGAPRPAPSTHECWAAVRLQREFWPQMPIAQALSAARSHPEVEVTDDRFRIFHGFGNVGVGGYGGQPAATIVSRRVSRADLVGADGHPSAAAARSHQYVIPSESGMIFFIVGPEHPPGSAPILRVRWGANARGLVLVTAHERDLPYRLDLLQSPATCDGEDGGHGWVHAAVPLLRSFGAGTPPLPKSGCKVKAAIEVCTNLRWPDGAITMRLEHHCQHRVAWPGWWLKASTAKRTGARGYGGGSAANHPHTLGAQATAAKGWMFACAEALDDSGWARALHASGIGFVKFMGFETNNPLHDDHEGRGAHWHPTVRHRGAASATQSLARFAGDRPAVFKTGLALCWPSE